MICHTLFTIGALATGFVPGVGDVGANTPTDLCAADALGLVGELGVPSHGALTGHPPRGLGPRPDCDDPAADEWIRDARDRSLRSSALVAWAVEVHGEPVSCEGTATQEFDGVKYGMLRLAFAGGVVYELITMPVQTSIALLRSESGFADPVAARELLVEYASRVGVAIDWEDPDRSSRGGERFESYTDPDPGLNATATLIFSGDTLVGIQFSMAL